MDEVFLEVHIVGVGKCSREFFLTKYGVKGRIVRGRPVVGKFQVRTNTVMFESTMVAFSLLKTKNFIINFFEERTLSELKKFLE